MIPFVKTAATDADETEIVLDVTDNKTVVKKELKKFAYYAIGGIVGAVIATIIIKSGADDESTETED